MINQTIKKSCNIDNHDLLPQSKIHINLDALVNNIKVLKSKCLSGVELMAVVKANGYGHGAVMVAKTALKNGASFLAVARIHEAVELISAGINAPILLFGDVLLSQVEWLLLNGVRITIGSLDAAKSLSDAILRCPYKSSVKVHIKVDTGMGRLGFVISSSKANFNRVVDEIIYINSMEGVDVEGIYTHFSNSDVKDKSDTNGQIQKFNNLIDALKKRGVVPKICHASNSAAIIEIPEGHFNMVRAGVAMYGLFPSDEISRDAIKLEPVMSVTSKIIHLKDVPAGFKVSYGSTHVTSTPTKIATVPIGYADGYNRLLSSKAEMLVKGTRCKVVGRVCMDYTMIDVGDIKDVQVGDEVVVMGRQGNQEILADEIARHINTINYEVVCSFDRRMPTIFQQAHQTDSSL
ncbi:MAG: alanine racemase [Desulfamplus sp.]|nr:alanine racemase [Desulfamplus sp.]